MTRVFGIRRLYRRGWARLVPFGPPPAELTRMVELRRLATDEMSPDLVMQIRRLLDRAFEGDFADSDWEHALGGVHLVATEDGAVVAHAAVVARTLAVAGRELHTGYVEAVATAPERQQEGFGSLVMDAASGVLRAEYEMGALGTGSHGFYTRLGWESWRGPTYARDGAVPRRTEADDDGVMVLRFGSSAGVDLDAAISCDARNGDDW